MPINMNDMVSVINSLKKGNPNDIMLNALKQQQGNPIAQNLVDLINKGNTKEVEQVARNIAKEKGIDFDKEFNAFKQMFRL